MHYVQETIEIYITNLCLSYRYICSIISTGFDKVRSDPTQFDIFQEKVKKGEINVPPCII